MKTVSFIPCALLAAVALACSAPGPEKLARRAAPIAGGSPDTLHEAVFKMVSHQDQSGRICTSTLIAPNLLLTARHCVSPGSSQDILCGASQLGPPYPANAIYATNDRVPGDDSPFFQGSAIVVPDEGADTCGFDMALITLAENVPENIAAPAIPRIDREVEEGEPYTAVGYGNDETGEPTAGREMRSGLAIACTPGLCGFGVESTEFRGETGICNGDSGGPAVDADGKVLGVVSRGGQDCGSPVYGAVAAWRDWIMATAEEAARVGDYPPPFWVLSGISDPPNPMNPDAGAAGGPGAGGADPGPDPTPDPLAGQGEPCASPDECIAGYACFSPDGTPEGGRCAALCDAEVACNAGGGLVCTDVGGAGVCLPGQGSADDDGGCSIGPSPRGSKVTALLGLTLAMALLGRRRRSTR